MTAVLEVEDHKSGNWHSKDVKSFALELFARGATQSEVHSRTGVPVGTLKRWRVAAKRAAASGSSALDCPPQAVAVAAMTDCPNDCGTSFAVRDLTRKVALRHLASCPRANSRHKFEAIQYLNEKDTEWLSVAVLSTTSQLSNETSSKPSTPKTSGELVNPSGAVMTVKAASEDDWSKFTADLKAQLWGELEDDGDYLAFAMDKFSPLTGEVNLGWSVTEWQAKRWAGIGHTPMDKRRGYGRPSHG